MAGFKRVFFMLCALALTIAPAFAQQPSAGQQNEFVPVSQLPTPEQMPAGPLVIAAYAFVWLAVLFYLWSIWRRINRVEADMRALQRRSPERSSSR